MIEEWDSQHFHRNFTLKKKEVLARTLSLMGWKIFTIGQDHVMNFSHSYISGRNLVSFLDQIQTSTIEHATLDYNHTPSICKAISSIVFLNIQTLSLSGNNIQSIQPLQQLTTPSLKLLLLEDNAITYIRTLRKMDLRSLQSLSLSINHISQIFNTITQLNSPYLEKVELCGNKCVDFRNTIMKMKSNYLKQLDIRNNCAFIQNKRSSILLLRMPSLSKLIY